MRTRLTEVECEGDGSREHKRTNQLNEDDKLHTEAESATKIPHEDQFHEVVYCTVDPSPTLGQENLELCGDRGLADSLRHKYLLTLRECPEHQRGQVAIFAEQEQVLLVQRVDHVLGIVFDNVRIGEDRDPVVLVSFRSFDAVHAEAARKTRYTTEY